MLTDLPIDIGKGQQRRSLRMEFFIIRLALRMMTMLIVPKDNHIDKQILCI